MTVIVIWYMWNKKDDWEEKKVIKNHVYDVSKIIFEKKIAIQIEY